MVLDFSFTLNYTPKNLIIGIPVWDTTGNMITAFNTDHYKVKVYTNSFLITGKLITNCSFNPSEYTSIIAIVDGSEYLYRQTVNNFKVKQKERIFGFVTLPHIWEIKR
jgi:hypothetical protein